MNDIYSSWMPNRAYSLIYRKDMLDKCNGGLYHSIIYKSKSPVLIMREDLYGVQSAIIIN